MNIDCIFLKSETEYSPSSNPTLYIVSDRKLADCLTGLGEAVCISLTSEDELPSFEGYKYFITDGVPNSGHLEKIWCHIKNAPYEIGCTERISVREEIPEDLPLIYEMYDDDACRKYLEDLPPIDSFDAKERFESVKNGYMLYEYGMWIVEKKDTHEVIGRVGFEYLDETHVSIGYMIKKDERNKGFAKEAVRVAVDYLKKVCPETKIVANCDSENTASIKIAACGLALEAVTLSSKT